ncbi:MAG: hypothetical protein PHD25_12050 [Bacteroidales bacterium]|nr:hypothetical protein [Bacteroidales bacterium]
MKRSILNAIAGLLLISFFFTYQQTFAQPGEKSDKPREVIQAHKIAFITDRLDLTPDEAQRFWPVYNEYQDKREMVQKEMFKDFDIRDMDIDALTDEQATEIADNQIIKAQKLLDVQKEYHIHFKEVLSGKKVLKLYQAEKEFQHELLRKIRDDRPYEPGQPKRW